MPTGTVKWFNPEKGFGFITPDVKGADVFLHHTALEKAEININRVYEGVQVSFDITDGPKGKQAAEVRIID